MKVNMELSEKEAKKYFHRKPMINLKPLKKKLSKLKDNPQFLIAIGLLFFAILTIFLIWIGQAQYKEGYEAAQNEIRQAAIKADVQNLMHMSLPQVWEWFAKRALIVLGYGLPMVLLVMAVVWIIHGGFFKIM